MEEKKSELRNKDREMEDGEERHQVEIKVMKQKVKHLLYEQQNNLAQLKSEAQLDLKINQESHDEAESHLRHDKRNLKINLKEQELAHEDVIRNLKKVCSRPSPAVPFIKTDWFTISLFNNRIKIHL